MTRFILSGLLLGGVLDVFGAAESGPVSVGNGSLRHEVQRAIDRGTDWLVKHQSADGSWSTPETTAVTSLALVALSGAQDNPSAELKAAREKGYAFLDRFVQPDGSVYNKKEQVNYNTSLALMAFSADDLQKRRETILKARKFLIGSQNDLGEKGALDSPYDGGVGYGSKYDHSDMGNTIQALEALYLSKKALAADGGDTGPDLNWQAAIHFLQNCQNLPSHNRQPWASDDAQNKGGFIYYPGQSMAGAVTNASGRVALRSYGSISYAGLTGYIYADLKKDDPRVNAVVEWLKTNFTLEENPGMGQQGLYYYLQMMTKALTVSGLETIPAGTAPWREQVALRFMNLQKQDGSWQNETARWWEKDPALVTSYAVISLKMIARKL